MQHQRIRELAMGANRQPDRIAWLIRLRVQLHQFHNQPHLHRSPEEPSADSSEDSSGPYPLPGQPMPVELHQALSQMVEMLNQLEPMDPISLMLSTGVTFRLNLQLLEELSSRLLISKAPLQAKH